MSASRRMEVIKKMKEPINIFRNPPLITTSSNNPSSIESLPPPVSAAPMFNYPHQPCGTCNCCQFWSNVIRKNIPSPAPSPPCDFELVKSLVHEALIEKNQISPAAAVAPLPLAQNTRAHCRPYPHWRGNQRHSHPSRNGRGNGRGVRGRGRGRAGQQRGARGYRERGYERSSRNPSSSYYDMDQPRDDRQDLRHRSHKRKKSSSPPPRSPSPRAARSCQI